MCDKVRYCLPIQKPTRDEVREAIRMHRDTYDFLEVWLHEITDLDSAFLDELVEELGERLIVLFRRPHLAPVMMPLLLRHQLLQQLSGTPAWVDLDITTQTADLRWIQENASEVKLLLSYHNYETTPPNNVLWEHIDMMLRYNPSIVKVATHCQTQKDALRLMYLGLSLHENHIPCIVLGMGEHGLITRVFGSLWFNTLTFAPHTPEHASAPGQLSLASMTEIIAHLQRANPQD